jgi:hypothetical protein
MFQTVSLLAFAAILGGILLHSLVFPCGYKPRFTFGAVLRKGVHLLTLLFLEQSRGWPARFRKLALMLGLLCFLVLGLTGFLPLLLGGRLGGYWLMLHATVAPVFIACIAFVVVSGAQQYQFCKQDSNQFIDLWKTRKTQGACCLTDFSGASKVGFWLLAALSLPVALSMAISMTPLFGTRGQEFLFDVHRWSALAFALVALWTIYLVIRSEIRKDL